MNNKDKRRINYAHLKCIEWDNEIITVDEANQIYLYCIVEDDNTKASELKSLIKAAKNKIREEFK